MKNARIYVLFAAYFSIILAVLTLVGWHLNIPSIVKLSENSSPLHYDAALGFLLVGSALLCLVYDALRPLAIVIALFVLVLALVTLGEYFSIVSLSFDQFFISGGRMSTNTAVALCLEAICLILLATNYQLLWCTILATLTFCLGFISFFGEFALLESLYSTSEVTYISPQAAFTIVLQGAAFMLLSLYPFHKEKTQMGHFTTTSDEIPQNKTCLRILLCEDDKDFAYVLQKIFQYENCIADIAFSAKEAKELAKKNVYDLVTLDLVLPDSDGATLAKDLREEPNTRYAPITVISNTADQEEVELRKRIPSVIACMNKPFPQENLKNILHDLRKGFGLKSEVLYVENDVSSVEFVQWLLKEEANVTPAATIADARKKLGEKSFDLVLLSINLPDGSGLELMPCTDYQTGAAIPSVVLSVGMLPSEYQHHISYHLRKTDVSKEQLRSIIKTVAKRK